MIDKRAAWARIVAAVWLAACAGLALAQVKLTPQEEAGKRIYLEGVSPSGTPIQAMVGQQGTSMEGSALPCVNCHGADGTGRPEGAVKPSNVVWRELAKSYGHRHENGREHGPFDEQKFVELLTYGTDPAGNKVDPTMPRYIMSHKDMADLVAYLKRIDVDLDPGIGAAKLRIGTLLPTKGRLGELGQAMSGILASQVEEMNAAGGLFGRKIELVPAEFSDDRAATLANLNKLLREQEVFAVVSPFTVGLEADVSAVAEKERVPMVGPFTLFPDSTLAVNRYTFYLLSGLREQGRALAKFATGSLKLANPEVGLVYPESAGYKEVVEAAEEMLKEGGWTRVHRAGYAQGQPPSGKLVADLQQKGVQAIFFFGNEAELAAFGKLVRDAIWSPYLLALGPKVARAALDLPTTFGDRVYLAYPTLPEDVSPAGAAALSGLQRKGKLTNRHQPAQISAYASILVLEEGVKRAGRDLSRAKFVGSLENLFSFESGVTPSISYGPNRRIGALGAHIVSVDLGARRFKPTGQFVRLD